MQIFNPNDELIVDGVDDSTYLRYDLMSVHNVTVYVSSVNPIPFKVGSYLTFQNIRYTVRKKSAITKNSSRNLSYTVIFEAPQADTEKRTVRNPSDKKLKFPYTAKPVEHLELMVWNMNQVGTGGWTVGECIDAPEALVSYNFIKCWDAIKNIADTFNTEFEIENKTIHLRKVEYNRENPISLAYGSGNGFKTGIRRDNVDSSVPIEILAVQGGTRNIDFSKYGNSELLLPKEQTIAFDGAKFEDEEGFDPANAKTYIVDDEGLTIQRADKELFSYEEGSTDLSNIYPRRVGEVTAIEVTDQGFYNFIDTSIPEDLDYSKYRIDGEKMTVIFQGGNLSGKEFDLMQTDSAVTGYNHSQRKFLIVSQEYDGQTMPNDSWSIQVGDKYAVFGMMMPDQYVRNDADKSGASWEMFREAAKVMYEEEQDKFSFTGEIDGIWAKRDWPNIGGKLILGGYVRFTDNQIIESGEDVDNVLIRITGIQQYINDPYKPKITLANVTAATYNEDFRKIAENEVVAENDNKNTVNYVKRSYRGMMELVNNIYDPSGSFQEDLLSAVALRTMVLSLGDPILQFSFLDSSWTNEIEPAISYNPESGKIECGDSYVRHNTIGIDTVQPDRDKTAYLYWQIPSYSSAVLTDNPTQFYYLFLKVSRTYTTNPDGLKIGTGEFFISTEKLQYDSDPDNYILQVGFLNSEEASERVLTLLYGFAELTPGMLRINNIASTDGNSFMRLLANQFKFGDSERYFAWNVVAGLLEIMGASITVKNTDNETVASIDGQTGEALFAKGSIQCKANGDVIATGKFSTKDPSSNFRLDLEGPNIDVFSISDSINVGGVEGTIVGYNINGNDIYSPTAVFESKYNDNKFTATGVRIGGSSNDNSKQITIDWNQIRSYLMFVLRGLPTSALDLDQGQLWNDNGTLKIVL